MNSTTTPAESDAPPAKRTLTHELTQYWPFDTTTGKGKSLVDMLVELHDGTLEIKCNAPENLRELDDSSRWTSGTGRAMHKALTKESTWYGSYDESLKNGLLSHRCIRQAILSEKARSKLITEEIQLHSEIREWAANLEGARLSLRRKLGGKALIKTLDERSDSLASKYDSSCSMWNRIAMESRASQSPTGDLHDCTEGELCNDYAQRCGLPQPEAIFAGEQSSTDN